MTSLIKSLGVFQATLLLCRVSGFLRDSLLIFFLGATALTDHVFFFLGFTELLTSMIVGGGAALYITHCFQKKKHGVYWSSLLFYSSIAVIFALVESNWNTIGQYFYPPLTTEPNLWSPYSIVLLSIIFTFPLAVYNAVFLYTNKYHMQPAMNVVYIFLLLLGIGYLFFMKLFTLTSFCTLVVLAALLRFLFSTWLSSRHYFVPLNSSQLIVKASFYRSLFLSGLSVGLLVAVPFVFRGGLTEFGNGAYSTSAFTFKINDMAIALFVAPLCSLVLKRWQANLKTLAVLLTFSVGMAAMFFTLIWLVETYMDWFLIIIKDHNFDFNIIKHSLMTIGFTAVAFVFSMFLVKLDKTILLTLMTLMLLGATRIPLFYEFSNVSAYFYNLYCCYILFLMLIASYVFFLLVQQPQVAA